MDNRPIGVFDSGVGGLTSINSFTKILPDENIIYFGDTARAPYGSKSPKAICDFSVQIADFLVEQGAKALVIACNTITSTALVEIKKAHPEVLVQGIIEPSAREIARTCTPENSIGIIGTMVTVSSKAYERALYGIRGDLNVHALACPAFVPLIEEGAVESETMELTIHHYLDNFTKVYNLDTLVLGCTHYPIIRGIIEKLYPQLNIIDPSEALALTTKKLLEEHDMLSDGSVPRKNIFYASDLSADFVNMLNRLGIDGNFAIEQHRF